MLKWMFWEDEDRKDAGQYYHCCSVDESECSGTFNTWFREKDYQTAKEKMLQNLIKLRDDLNELIDKEIGEK